MAPNDEEALEKKEAEVIIHPATLPDDKLLQSCQVERTRRTGPGGQHRNKVETAVVICHLPTGISAEANEKRSQEENRKVALLRLRVNLAIHHRVKRIRKSDLLASRIQKSRIVINVKHHDFPAILAEVLDILAATGFEIPDSAKILEITGSQLLKFLKTCPPAFEYFNRERQAIGLPRIKF